MDRLGPNGSRVIACVVVLLAWSIGPLQAAPRTTLRTGSGVVWAGEVLEADERGVLLRTPEDVEVLVLWCELSDESREQVTRLTGRPAPEVPRSAVWDSAAKIETHRDPTPISGDEAYERMIAERRPRTVEEHRACALECGRRGLSERVSLHHALADALGLEGFPQTEALKQVEALCGGGAPGLAARDLAVVEERLLAQDFSGAVERLRSARGPISVQDLVQSLSERTLPGDRLSYLVYLALDRRLRELALDATQDCAGAEAQTKTSILRQAVEDAARGTGMGSGQAAELFARRSASLFLFAGYGSASWMEESPGLADCEAWWKSADLEDRTGFLRGRLAESVLQVAETRHKECPQCGGSGRRGEERCSRCLGLGEERVVIFR